MMEQTTKQNLISAIAEQGLPALLKEIERLAVIEAMTLHETRSGGAQMLKINRTTYIEMMRRHGLFVAREFNGGTLAKMRWTASQAGASNE